MGERRSMGDALALDADKIAFIHSDQSEAEQSREKEPVAKGNELVTKATKVPPANLGMQRRRGRPRKPAEPQALASAEAPIGVFESEIRPLLVPLTTRLSPATAEALRRASLELRLERRKAHTQQEIVEAAVRHWLFTNGFLRAT